jgi:MFS family permease
VRYAHPWLTSPRRGFYYGWALVATLSVTETVSWGILYYAFAVMLQPMEADLGWSRADLSGAFSLAVLISGIAAVPVGRWLDRRGSRLLMTAGSCAATLLVLAWSGARDLVAFYAIWAAIGVTMAAVLYEPAFAVITTWFRRRRARALLVLTLAAGLASTIFVPLAAWLVQLQGWRQALVTLAAILGVGTILPHALLLRRRPEDLGLQVDGATDTAPEQDAGAVRAAPLGQTPPRGMPFGAVMRLRSFPWLTAAFFLYGLASTGISVHLVAYLGDRGYGLTFAAAAAGAIGAMQLVGRLLFAPLERHVPRRFVTAVVLLVQPVAFLALLLFRNVAGVLAFVALFGASRGAATLARATAVADLYGAARFGSISGVLALFVTLAHAGAPLAMGAGYDLLGSYEPLLWLLFILAAAAGGAALLVGRQ